MVREDVAPSSVISIILSTKEKEDDVVFYDKFLP